MTTPEPDEPPPDISDEARALVGLYLESRRADLGRLAAAIAARDFEAIRAVGHMFHGSSDAFGYPEAGRIGTQLEDAADRADLEAVEALALRLNALIEDHGPGIA